MKWHSFSCFFAADAAIGERKRDKIHIALLVKASTKEFEKYWGFDNARMWLRFPLMVCNFKISE